MLEIYQMAEMKMPCQVGDMALGAGKKAEAEQRSRVLYARLMALKPDDLSERAWLRNAGVNSSFFSNLRNKGAEPTIGNLRAVLEAIGLTIPEFFVSEAQGRLFPAPSEQELTEAIRRVLPGLPATTPSSDRRAEYLAATVLDVLGLPRNMRATQPSESSDEKDAGEEGSKPQTSTK